MPPRGGTAYPMPEHLIRVAIVEDNPQIREGICSFLSNSSGFECTLVCESAEEALEKLPQQPGSRGLREVGVPGMAGIGCTHQWRGLPNQLQGVLLAFLEG